VTASAATQTLGTGTVITQGSAVSAATMAKKKYKGKAEQGEGPSSEPEIVIPSFIPGGAVRYKKKDFSHHKSKSLTTWLI